MEILVEKYSVASSNISSIGYDPSLNTLEVEFWNGSIYQYFNVPKNLHEKLMETPLKGRFLHKHIKDAYPYSRVG